MICPMLSSSSAGTSDCLKQRCAWWNDGSCAICSIATTLSGVEQSLDSVCEKLDSISGVVDHLKSIRSDLTFVANHINRK